MSPFRTFADIVKDFLKARKDPEALQVWVNTILGEPWEDPSERLDASSLSERAENYDGDTLPDGIRLLVAGVDVQDNRLELQVLGFGQGEECWTVQYD